jgi:hypothetical protein
MTSRKTISDRKWAKKLLEVAGDDFAEWINSESAPARAHKRVMESALSIAKLNKGPGRDLDLRGIAKLKTRIRKITRWIAETYPSQYTYAGISVRPGRVHFGWEPLRAHARGEDWRVARQITNFEFLVERGALGSIYRCEWHKCRRYFFAGRRGQQFCSRGCSEKKMRQTEKWKRKNRKNQREFRKRWKSEGGDHGDTL